MNLQLEYYCHWNLKSCEMQTNRHEVKKTKMNREIGFNKFGLIHSYVFQTSSTDYHQSTHPCIFASNWIGITLVPKPHIICGGMLCFEDICFTLISIPRQTHCVFHKCGKNIEKAEHTKKTTRVIKIWLVEGEFVLTPKKISICTRTIATSHPISLDTKRGLTMNNTQDAMTSVM